MTERAREVQTSRASETTQVAAWPALVRSVARNFLVLHIRGASKALEVAAPPPIDIEFTVHH